ncbi:MAG TPA: ribonuclease Y [Flexilinea sp.]|jgi:ribonuclease Y|nr:ribonuclease Y [Flexilinea sp.]OQA27786.1 MAG: Ribonuclease Y [Chloroflexi bacterium ADurb.Bin344]HNY93650.1 ribonuclease Y [Flexilinea sp.]HOG21971.1 ribonuclease Y [Flexilinea sp.]HOG60093.1 ribonuclease Y [Flexilinea sp.]
MYGNFYPGLGDNGFGFLSVSAQTRPPETGSNLLIIILAVVIGLLLVVTATFFITRYLNTKFMKSQQLDAENIILVSRQKAQEIEEEARENANQIAKDAETEIKRRRGELTREEDRLQKRRAEIDARIEKLEQREANLNKRQSNLDKRSNEIDKMAAKQLEELQKIAQMTTEEARQELLNMVEKDSRNDMARIIRQIEQEARMDGEKKAREIIATAIQRIASDQVSEVTTSIVNLPGEEMKGRIVGRNGRNIRAFEQAAGVDVIVDDTPEAVMISCFDPIRREVARRALDRLILDGRIHPANIEKTLNEEEKEVQKLIIEAGEQAAFEAGVVGLHPEIIKMLGRLKYRTSYGQNQLSHSVEVAKLSSVIASELGANVELARLGALLHDLGKAMDHNTEGTHAKIGAEFAKRYGVNPKAINIIESHHHEVDQESVEAVIVEAADAISGARPGARREDLELYIKRLRALEEIANSHKGVQNSYAIQAGREIRIIVTPEEVDDLEATYLARDIAHQVEETMQYPGQIKVTVIRETRAVDYAK